MLVLCIGTRWPYLCTRKTTDAMRNTDYDNGYLGSFISSDASFQALQDIIDDLGLEVEDVIAL